MPLYNGLLKEMDVDASVYGTALMALCAFILAILSVLALVRSWKDGQFLVLTLCLGLLCIALSALTFTVFRSVFPSLYVLCVAGAFISLSFFVVLPMTNRRMRYRNRRAR